MLIRRTIRNNKARKALNAFFAVALLLLYLAGNTGSGIVHQLFHGRQSLVLHTPAQEKDVCHRAIYHFGKDPRHNSHVTVNDKTDRCHLLVHADQLAITIPSHQAPHRITVFLDNLTVAQIGPVSVERSSRAPPLV